MTKRRRSREVAGSPSPATDSTLPSRFIAAAIVLFAGACYLNTLHHPFFYDDFRTVIDNPAVRNLHALGGVIRGSNRPLENLLYAVEYALFGNDPVGYHVTSIVLHMANVLLLFVLSAAIWDDVEKRRERTVSARSRIVFASACAALLGVHPLLSESVGYTSARPGVLCTTWLLVGMLAMRRVMLGAGARFVVAAIACWLLALASKETGAVLPFAWVAYELFVGPGTAEARRRRFVRLYLPMLALMLVGGALRIRLYLQVETGQLRPLWQQQLTQLPVIVRYLGLFVAPVRLSVVHEVVPVSSLAEWAPWAAAALLAAIAIVGWRVRARAPIVPFGLAWFFVFLLPSTVIALSEHMAEHRLYEASCGLIWIVGSAIAAGEERLRERSPSLSRAFVIAGALAIVAIGSATIARNRVWENAHSLWEDAVEKAPRVWASRYALADTYREAGDCARAVEQYQAAIEIFPSEPRAFNNLGLCLAQLGRTDEAIDALQRAAGLDPKSAQFELNLGLLEAGRGNAQAAREHFGRAIVNDPSAVRPRVALAMILRSAFNDPAGADRLCQEAIRLAPDSPDVATCR
jgi:Flp pilus assembly protein TadD